MTVLTEDLNSTYIHAPPEADPQSPFCEHTFGYQTVIERAFAHSLGMEDMGANGDE